MAQYNITLNEEILHQLFSGDNNGLINLLQQVLDQYNGPKNSDKKLLVYKILHDNNINKII